jgi:hypothetical protein
MTLRVWYWTAVYVRHVGVILKTLLSKLVIIVLTPVVSNRFLRVDILGVGYERNRWPSKTCDAFSGDLLAHVASMHIQRYLGDVNTTLHNGNNTRVRQTNKIGTNGLQAPLLFTFFVIYFLVFSRWTMRACCVRTRRGLKFKSQHR